MGVTAFEILSRSLASQPDNSSASPLFSRIVAAFEVGIWFSLDLSSPMDKPVENWPCALLLGG